MHPPHTKTTYDFVERKRVFECCQSSIDFSFDYSNNGDIAIYNLALLGTSGAAAAFKSLVSQFYLNNTQSDFKNSAAFLNAIFTSRAIFLFEISPRIVQPCFMSGNT